MDLFVDLVAWASMPGIACVMVGPGLLGATMPLLLVIGVLDERPWARQSAPVPSRAAGTPRLSRP